MHLGGKGVDVHVAARGVDHLHRVTALFALFHQAAGGVVVLAAEDRNAQHPVRCRFADVLGGIDGIVQLGLAEPFRRGHGDILSQSLAAEKHMHRHTGPIGEGDFDRPAMAVDHQIG